MPDATAIGVGVRAALRGGMRAHLQLLLALSFTAAGCMVGDPPPDHLALAGGTSAGGQADGTCPTIPAKIAPAESPPFSCGPVDDTSESLMADINAFWGSQIGLCTCGSDYDTACLGASSRFTLGWVYLEPGFVERLSASAGSTVPGAYALAHEAGHELQGHFAGEAPHLIQMELGADCLAGYYLGAKQCQDGLSQRDIVTTLATACVIADGTGDPAHDLETHGTCQQRMAAIVQGIEAYQNRKPPLESCAF